MLRRMMMAGNASGGGDPYWSDVVALLNMSGANGSTSFPDATGLRAWARNGNVVVSTALGYNTARFDGSGDYLSTPYIQSGLDWWTSDFTIEAWVHATSLTSWSYMDGEQRPAMLGCAVPTSATNYWSFGPVSGTGRLSFYYYNGVAAQQVYGGTVPTGLLCHLAIVKSTDGIRLAVDGVLGAAVALVGTPLSSASGTYLTLGMINNRSIDGHVRALRITRSARWSSDFAPPAAPFPTA